MKQTLIRRNPNRLIIVFCGWGSDENLFASIQTDSSLLVCSNYSVFDFDKQVLAEFSETSLFAWSLGVWAADVCMQGMQVQSAIAYNGTPFPISSDYGIPEEIFVGTINNFSERSLHKFRLRMCGKNLSDFASPSASADELCNELKAIYENVSRFGNVEHIKWTKAYCAGADRIFPTANQQKAWQLLNVPLSQAGQEHFDLSVITGILKSV